MTLRGHTIADLEAAYLDTDIDDFATEFVADGHWHRDRGTSPVIPFVDVDIGTANRRPIDLDQDIVVADRRCGDVFHPDAAFRFCFYQRFHDLALCT